jgi:glycosyltransferase involved in cell wall biosynthesis
MTATTGPESHGVSFVIPVRDGEAWLEPVIEAVLAQHDGRPFEVLVIEDGSRDRSAAILEALCVDPRLRVVAGPQRGAAAALNAGIRRARHLLIAQVDQDVILHRGWLQLLLAALEDPGVAAAQGHYTPEPGAPLWDRVAAYDLEMRYLAVDGDELDQACTGNSVYRRQALDGVGLFDESMGYGYDNDMSYRLLAAGHRLLFVREARSTHRWRRGLGAFLRQQYGLGYGRLDLIARHPRRVTGDRVSRLGMILHVPGMLAVVLAVVAAVACAALRLPWQLPAAAAAVLLSILTAERLVFALRAARRFADLGALAIVPAHLLRDLAWVWATAVWTARRVLRRPSRPRHSMG